MYWTLQNSTFPTNNNFKFPYQKPSPYPLLPFFKGIKSLTIVIGIKIRVAPWHRHQTKTWVIILLAAFALIISVNAENLIRLARPNKKLGCLRCHSPQSCNAWAGRLRRTDGIRLKMMEVIMVIQHSCSVVWNTTRDWWHSLHSGAEVDIVASTAALGCLIVIWNRLLIGFQTKLQPLCCSPDRQRTLCNSFHIISTHLKVCHGIQTSKLDCCYIVSLSCFLFSSCKTRTKLAFKQWCSMHQHIMHVRFTQIDLPNVPRYKSLLPATRPILACHRPCWWCLVTPL